MIVACGNGEINDSRIESGAELQEILQAWLPFKQVVGITQIRTEEDYTQVRATIDSLLDVIGDNERPSVSRCAGSFWL